MPVEIRELVIRATVSPGEGGERMAPDPPRDARRDEGAQGKSLAPAELERIVSLCVGRVLRSMKRMQER